MKTRKDFKVAFPRKVVGRIIFFNDTTFFFSAYEQNLNKEGQERQKANWKPSLENNQTLVNVQWLIKTI